MITRSTASGLTVVTGLIALQDHLDHGAEGGIGRHSVPHGPAEQVRIIALQQADKGLLIGFAQGVELVFEKGHKNNIQLEHATAAGPLQAGFFNWAQHGTLLTKTRGWYQLDFPADKH